MGALFQSLSGLIYLGIPIGAILLLALTDEQRCNRLVRIIKAWRQRRK